MNKQAPLPVVSGHAQRASRKASLSEFDATWITNSTGLSQAPVSKGVRHEYKTAKTRCYGISVLFLFAWYGFAQAQSKETSKTQIVLLGTGTPAPDPEHSGPSTAIVVNGTPYLVDFGTGVVRQAAAAARKVSKGWNR